MAAPDPDLGDGWRYRVARENGSVSSKSWPLICPSILSTKSYVKPDIGGGCLGNNISTNNHHRVERNLWPEYGHRKDSAWDDCRIRYSRPYSEAVEA